jgi:tripartite-type tricarboxylate transporter receptor subunit TctC
MKKLLIAATLGIMGMSWGQGAWAQARPLQLIINFPAGAGTDIAGRAFAESFKQSTGRIIVVINRGGASGTIGVSAIANAAPDGNTLGFVTSIPITLQPHLIKDVTYTPVDLKPICRIQSNPTTLVASPQSGFERVSQVIEQARREPGKLNIGVPGLNSGPHLAVIEFLEAAKLNIVVVPHQADNNAIQPLRSGELQLAVAGVSFGLTNGFKVLAVSGRERLAHLPNVPTFTELGFPVVQTISSGIVGPKGLAPEFARAMEAACKAAYENADYQEFMKKLGLSTSYAGSAEFTAQLAGEYQSMKNLVQRLGLRN